MRTLTAFTLLILATTACGDTAPGRSSNATATLRLTPLPPIDGSASPNRPGFGSIADLAIGRGGSIFVLDEMNRTIQVFDGQGARLRTFGRRGAGPGELERPRALAWGPDGNLWVVDAGNARYTVFDTDGTLVATYRGPEPYVFYPRAVGFSADGHLYTVATALAFGSLERQNTVLIESVVRDGQVAEVSRVDLPFVQPPPVYRREGAGMVAMLAIPFASQAAFGFDADGRLWYAETGAPWVRLWSRSSGFQQSIGTEFDPPRISPTQLQAVLEREAFADLRRTAGEDYQEFVDLIPEVQPHLAGFFFAGNGNLWIMRSRGAAAETRRIDIYSPNGTLVATVRADLLADPRPRVRDGLLVGVIRDELGVESVARYRVQ